MNGCPHNIASSLTAMGDKDSVLPSETDEDISSSFDMDRQNSSTISSLWKDLIKYRRSKDGEVSKNEFDDLELEIDSEESQQQGVKDQESPDKILLSIPVEIITQASNSAGGKLMVNSKLRAEGSLSSSRIPRSIILPVSLPLIHKSHGLLTNLSILLG